MFRNGALGVMLGLAIAAFAPVRAENFEINASKEPAKTGIIRLAATLAGEAAPERPGWPDLRYSPGPDRDAGLRAGFDPAAHAEPGKVDPLHWAALQNQATVLQRLIERGHDVDARDGDGRTPLMVAASFGSIESAVALVELGAGLDLRDRHGDAPIHFAARGGHAGILNLLLAEGVDAALKSSANGESALHFAAKYGHSDAIEALVDAGGDVNAVDNDGVAPLFYANKRRRGEIVDLLLSLGAREGGLIEAVNANDVERVQKLIASGVDVNAPGLDGTALHLAAAKGYVWLVGMLLDAGADIEAIGEPGGAHPLHLAVLHDQAAAAKLLLTRGANVEARDAWGRTPLHIASAFGAVATTTTLLDQGADLFASEESYGDMPIHMASWGGHVELLKLFLARGVDINARSHHDGESPLHYAAQWNQLAVIRFLVANGADLHMGDDAGATPLHYARAKSNVTIGAVPLLISLGARE